MIIKDYIFQKTGGKFRKIPVEKMDWKSVV